MILELLQTVLGAASLAGGCLLFVVAAIGLIRLPDAYTRLTAVTKSATLGICLLFVGVLVLDPSLSAAIKLLAAIALQLITAPVGGFALSRATYRAGVPLPPNLRYDELSGHPGAPSQEYR